MKTFPLAEATAEVCARIFINNIFLHYGTPRRVISDNGIEFINTVMQYIIYCMGSEQVLTPLYHPETNPVERKNCDLKSRLAMVVKGDYES